MDINTVLLLATLFSLTHQSPVDYALRKIECISVRENSNIEWHQHAIYHDDCPAVKALLNPFTTVTQRSNKELCLCEGNFNWWPLTKYNVRQHHICQKLSNKVTPHSPFLCWINNGTDNNRYTLKFQKPFRWPAHHDCEDVDTLIPPLFDTYQKLKPHLENDPRCNGHLGEKLRAQTLERAGHCKQRDCKQKNYVVQTFKYKNNHR